MHLDTAYEYDRYTLHYMWMSTAWNKYVLTHEVMYAVGQRAIKLYLQSD